MNRSANPSSSVTWILPAQSKPRGDQISARKPLQWSRRLVKSSLAKGRIYLTYFWRHRRKLRLGALTTFTELVQWRKLYDRDPRLPLLTDKVRVKAWVAELLGIEWVIPTLWHGIELPGKPSWPVPFVVKSRHGCNQRAFVRTGREDWFSIRRRSRGWMRRTYGAWLDEWAYRDLTPGLLVEPFVGVGGQLPIDYKFYVFAGKVAFIQVHLDREYAHQWILLDRDWQRVSARTDDLDPSPPLVLAEMISAAETLGEGFSFVRVDLYEVGDRPMFGEMTFYPGSGLDPFAPVSLDADIGAHWLAALQTGAAGDAGITAGTRSPRPAAAAPRPETQKTPPT